MKKNALMLLLGIVMGATIGSVVAYQVAKPTVPKAIKASAPKETPTHITPDKSKANTEVPVVDLINQFDKYLGLDVIAVGKLTKARSGNEYLILADNNQGAISVDTSDLKTKPDSYLGKQVKVTGNVRFHPIGDNKNELSIKAISISS